MKRNSNQCPDCGYEATDKVDAYVHVLSKHNGSLSNVPGGEA